MSTPDIGISSREMSVQVGADEVTVAYTAVPGLRGPAGPAGEDGGTFGAFLGAFDPANDYEQNNVVTWANTTDGAVSTYICFTTPPEGLYPTPDNTSYWKVLAQGVPGGPGPQGPPGGTIEGMAYVGMWATGTSYSEGDIVSHTRQVITDGQSAFVTELWRCLANHTAGVDTPYATEGTLWTWFLTGYPGRRGQQGTTGKPGVRWRGTWATGKTYAPGDGVIHEGSSYRAVGTESHTSTNANGPEGASSKWVILARKGDTGPAGPASTVPGPAGPAGSDAVGWLALEFTVAGTKSIVLPEAATVKAAAPEVSGTAVVTIKKNGTTITADTTCAKGDVISITANNPCLVSLGITGV